ncbi:MarR family transcriptional regulator [Modestobacter versicolor]|uniref:MarR family transcriptional regulator n=1 Tax=Modestobacter versicolor TaxID=429133 RepID=A0A323VX96_9ACTN|nr:MarR family transcriptional regulator [Modestobacter versicolor]
MDLVDVLDRFVRLETVLWNALDARLVDASDVTLGRLQTLRVIQRTPDCRVHDVVQQLAITVGGASKAVDRIEAAGLCRRRAHPTDRRSSILEVTPAGERLIADGTALLRAELTRRMGAVLPDGTLREFAAVVDRLLAAHDDIEAGG